LVNDDSKYDEVALIDNIQRADLLHIDEAEAVNSNGKYGYSQDQMDSTR